MIVEAKPLTPEAFVQYGQVLMGTGSAPQRNEFAAQLENHRDGAKPNMTFIRAVPVPRPFRIQTLEQHPYSSQAFIPLNGTRYIVAVCPSDDEGRPLIEKLSVFIADGTQALNYNARVWHSPNMVFDGQGEFIMLRWDDKSPEDTKIHPLDSPVEIEIVD